jgi:hypothetical protein
MIPNVFHKIKLIGGRLPQETGYRSGAVQKNSIAQ